MNAIVIRGNSKPIGFAGLAGLRARAGSLIRRATIFMAATALIGAAGAALFQLVVELLSFATPIAVTGITALAVALLNSLRRFLRTRSAHRRLPAGERRTMPRTG